MKKKILVCILLIGCLLILAGCMLKIGSQFADNKEEEKIKILSVKEAIAGEVGYYLENDNLVVSYIAKNKALNDVRITKATFIIEEYDTNKEVYRKTVDVDKQVKAKKKITINFDNVEFSADELINYNLKVEVD